MFGERATISAKVKWTHLVVSRMTTNMTTTTTTRAPLNDLSDGVLFEREKERETRINLFFLAVVVVAVVGYLFILCHVFVEMS